jgi:uncharacterized protein (DUF305 family)
MRDSFRSFFAMSLLALSTAPSLAADPAPAAAPAPAINAMAASNPDPDPATSPATAAYRAALSRMYTQISVVYSGDVDRDLANMMIPHSQGAIDLGRTQVGFGRDPEMRRIVETMMKNREQEMALFRAWLVKREKAVQK